MSFCAPRFSAHYHIRKRKSAERINPNSECERNTLIRIRSASATLNYALPSWSPTTFLKRILDVYGKAINVRFQEAGGPA